ncbi:MAG TPA: G1 family glutamic endopeptidase [Candidatus Saccharimonadales bacterium]|nr:G1 family glutamic endopeptidase [Candidatus Saccharimonadales bacterium]
MTHIESTSKKSSSNQVKVTPKKPTVVTPPAPQPTPTAPAPIAVAPTKPPVTTKPLAVRTSNKVEPVVAPAPTSSVSGLTPTAPAPTSSSSPSPSPTSSSGGSGSSSSSPPQVTSGYTSTNWSGYLASGGSYTAVSASWKATSPTGNGSSTSADSTWIGIGGVTSADLIQIGTENTVSASGQVSTAAFYELLPNSAIFIPSLSVTPGDGISADINEVANNQWTMTITDTTSNQSFTTTVSYQSTNSTAEWIEEDPSYSSGSQIPMDNFGSVDITSASTVSNGSTLNLNTSSAQPITMVTQSGQPVATPSYIGPDGASFDVTED